MANTASQAQQIKDLLIEKFEAYDPTINTGQGSAFYSQVVEPVFAALGSDPFDTDIEQFLLSRLRQEFPTIPAESGDAVVDLLIRPLQLLLESFKRELQIIRTGQSTNYASQMRLQDAEDLAANFFVTRRTGSRASGVVRIFYRQPTFVTVQVTTEFRTSEGLSFFPTVPQFFRPETVAVQRSGDLYYIDVTVLAEAEGEEYNIAANEISSVSGLTGSARVTNLFAFGGGGDAEDAAQLLQRTRTSLTERSLVTRRGIRARLFDDFTTIRNMEVVGYGDPEMQRDKVTGGGGMDNLCSGMCLVLGRYVMLFSMFENNGPDEDIFIEEGGVIELNFWKFLYSPDKNKGVQRFTVETVIYNSASDLENIPTVYLLKLDDAPDMEAPSISTLPGLLPGVFFTAYKPAVITISDIPGGITNPDAEGRILVEDGAVHIGGHYDVYLRPSQSNTATTSMTLERSEVALIEGLDLVTNGEILTALSLQGALKNKVHARLRLNIVPLSGTLSEGEAVNLQLATSSTVEEDTAAIILDFDLSEGYCDLGCLTRDNEWTEGDYVVGQTTGAVARIASIESTLWEDYGVERGMTLTIVSGADVGTYKILDVRGVELVLDLELTTLAEDIRFRVTDESVIDVFAPKGQVFPFGEVTANDLDTVIGSATVKVDSELSLYGVAIGDTLEILGGDNKGIYTIQGFDEVLSSRAPILDRVLRATDSNLEYVIYRPGSALTLPLVRIAPEGMSALDTAGQSSGFTIPPSEAVGAKAYKSFSGARASYLGLNGFVLPDPGPDWMPQGNTVVDIDQLDADGQLAYIEQYYGAPGDCYSRECLEYEDAFIAVVSIADMSSGTSGHDIRVHLDIDLPTEATDFLQTLRDWLVNVVESFELGDDFRSFIDLFAPITLDPVDTAAWNIIAQYEVLIPKQIFDGCNNVFVAIPEYNWPNEFDADTTFEDAMDKYNNGELKGGSPALTKAEPGSALTLLSGGNAGSYVIDKVYRYSLANGGTIQTADESTLSDDYLDKNKFFEIVLVCIDDAFPVEPMEGLAEYFSRTLPSGIALPTPPAFNVESTVRTGPDAGTVLGPWEVVQQAVTWLFQFLSSAGFDVPEEFVVNPDSVLKTLTQTLFTDYVVGNTTCEQIVRMKFSEPTSVTAYGNRPCFNYTWYEVETDPAVITSATLTLPLGGLDGAELAFSVGGLGTKEVVSATLSTELSAEEDPATFVSLLQSEMDADSEFLIFSYEQVGDHTLRVIVTSAEEGIDVKISGDADDVLDATRLLGFTEAGSPFTELYLNDGAVRAFTVENDTAKATTYLFMAFTVDAYIATWEGDALTDIGSPAIGDSIIQGAVTAVVIGILESSNADQSVTLVLDDFVTTGGGNVTIGGSSYSAPTYASAAPKPITCVGADVAGDDSPGSSASQYSDGTYITSPILVIAAAEARLSSTEAALSDLQTELSSGLEDFVSEAYADAIFAAVSSAYTAYVRGNAGYSYSFADFANVLTVSTTDTGTELEVSYEVDGGTYGSVTAVVLSIDSGDTSYAPLPLNLLPAVAQTVSLHTFTDYELSGEIDGETWGITPTSVAETDTVLEAVSDADGTALDEETIAQNLNGDSVIPFYASDGTTRGVLFYAPVDWGSAVFLDVNGAPTLGVRTLPTPADPLVLTAAIFDVNNFGDIDSANVAANLYPILGQGTSANGEEQVEYVHPKPPTLFSTDAGAAELLFTATGTERPFQVFPGETDAGRVAVEKLYRDISLSTHFPDAATFTARFSEPAYASPLLAGVQRGIDVLRIYEQRTLLEVGGTGGEPLPEKFDRVVTVTTEFGSPVIALPLPTTGGTPEFSFLSTSSDQERDEVVPGDVLFIEEGDDLGGYRVVSVSEGKITLDRTLTTTTAQIYQSGVEGVIDQSTTFYDIDAAFTSDDVGRYLTIFLSNYEGVDGSYQITSVTDSATVELDIPDGNFPVSEVGVHWAVVKAPVDELEDSEIDGATQLHGMVPIRIYNSIPTEWRIADFAPTVDRADSYLVCTYEGAEYPADNPQTRTLSLGPIRGYKQPYEIVREKVVHISSTAMKGQGRDNGFFYFDVRAKSLGGDAVYNIPENTPLTPVFGTYDSDGYRFVVEDPLFSFSMKEANTKLYFSPRFLPDDLNDVEDNKISTENLQIDVAHDYSALVASVQSVLLSADNRVLCADPLARHFLPSYVYFDVEAVGGSSAMGEAISDYIDGLEPEEALDISVFEKFLHQFEVTSYNHPLTVQILTHDLDRKAILTESESVIGATTDEEKFNGSHRTTYYIPGPVSTAADESDNPYGERIYIKRRGS